MPKEKYYLYREDGTEDIKVIKYKDNVNEVYSLTGAHYHLLRLITTLYTKRDVTNEHSKSNEINIEKNS
ncbi:DUF3269 family protein [Staphylococcus aureus]|uniref:DUF3269 family protein n=1 Tax=Staphylococcus aureus TaxID=1280 RepID=UPI0035B58B0D